MDDIREKIFNEAFRNPETKNPAFEAMDNYAILIIQSLIDGRIDFSCSSEVNASEWLYEIKEGLKLFKKVIMENQQLINQIFDSIAVGIGTSGFRNKTIEDVILENAVRFGYEVPESKYDKAKDVFTFERVKLTNEK